MSLSPPPLSPLLFSFPVSFSFSLIRLPLQYRMMSVPMSSLPAFVASMAQFAGGNRERRKKTAAERREQKLRSEARTIERLIKEMHSLSTHRGCQPTHLGIALAEALSRTTLRQPYQRQPQQQENATVVEFSQDVSADNSGKHIFLDPTDAASQPFQFRNTAAEFCPCDGAHTMNLHTREATPFRSPSGSA